MKLPSIVPVALFLGPLASALPQSQPVTTYQTLKSYCEATDAYVGVLYQSGLITSYKYNQCYPYSINGDIAKQAVFCKTVKCFSNPNADCTGGAFPPIGVPIPAGTTLVNVADFVAVIGKGATCEALTLT